jgi:hypothetical protein
MLGRTLMKLKELISAYTHANLNATGKKSSCYLTTKSQFGAGQELRRAWPAMKSAANRV